MSLAVKLCSIDRKTLIEEVLLNDQYGIPMTESARDTELMSMMESARNNIARVTLVETAASLQGLFLEGSLLMFPCHLFINQQWRNMTLQIDSSFLSGLKVSLATAKIHLCEEFDFAMIELPNCAMHKSIVKFFMKDGEIDETYDSGYLVKKTKKFDTIWQSVSDIEIDSKLSYYLNESKLEAETMKIDSHAHYNADTDRGDCGAPIFVVKKRINRKIIGCHVAGTTGIGYCNILSYEMLTTFMTKNFSQRLRSANIQCDTITRCDRLIRDDDVVELLGRVAPNLIPFTPTKTAIERSLICGVITDIATKPALLRHTDDIDPLRIGIAKSFVEDIHIPDWAMELAIRHTSHTFKGYRSTHQVNNGILSDFEVVNGIQSSDWVDSMVMSTSPGYPWNLVTRQAGKLEWFNTDKNGFRHAQEDLMKVVHKRENDLRHGIIPNFVFMDTLKDERRSLEKVLAGKTRVFACGTMDLTMLVRKYYSLFIAHMMENHVLGECSVGINPHCEEWGRMYEDARSHGDYWIAGDYGAFDKRLPFQVMLGVAQVTQDVMGGNPEIALVRKNLMMAMANALHLADNLLYRTHHGMPSGSAITAVGNSVANSILFRVAFLLLAEEQSGRDFATVMVESFSTLVSIKAYGDDHIIRVSKLIPWFNMPNIQRIFATFGMDYTNADKTTISLDFVPEEKLTYLKRSFTERMSYVYAPLDILSITEMFNWIRTNDDPKTATYVNCVTALCELSHYPEEDWQYYYDAVGKALKAARCKMPFLSYDVCLDRLLGLGCPNKDFLVKYMIEACSSLNEEEKRHFRQNQLKRNFEKIQGTIVMQMDGTSRIVNDGNKDTSELTGITKFSDQAGNKTEVQAKILRAPSGLDVYGTQTIIEFVERPYLIGCVEWKDTSKGVLKSFEFPTCLFDVVSIKQKIANFRFLRANLEVSFRVNASKMHYGKIMAAWTPAALNGLFEWSLKKESSYSGVYSCSGGQHCFISPTSSEVITMKMPYALPSLYMDLNDWTNTKTLSNVKYNMGIMQFFVLNSLRSAGAVVPSVDISVFARFTDVQLEGYTDNAGAFTYVPTPYGAITEMPKITGFNNICGGYYKKSTPTVLMQSGSHEANKKSEENSISDAFATGIQLVGDLVTTGARVIEAVGLMSGADKPNSMVPPVKASHTYGEYSLVRGIESASMLAATPDNRAGQMYKWMGSEDDCMHIKSFVSRFGLLHQDVIKVGDAAGTRYFMLPVHPGCIPYKSTTTLFDTQKGYIFYHNPLSFVAAAFAFWRGSITYKIQIVASAFHACRLRICWQPALPIAGSAIGILQSESNVVSHVLDVSTDTDFIWTVPFLNDNPALHTSASGVPNGYISMTLINTLAHPMDPVPDIEFNLWVAGGDDIEFFRIDPTNVSCFTFPTAGILMQSGTNIDEVEPKVPQKLTATEKGVEPKVLPSKPKTVLMQMESTDKLIVEVLPTRLENVLCGERILSIADIIKRPTYFYANKLVTDITFSPLRKEKCTKADLTNAPLLTYFMLAFKWWRGSITYKCIRNNDFKMLVSNRQDYNETTTPTAFTYTELIARFGHGTMFYPAKKEYPVDVTVPYYSNDLFLPVQVNELRTIAYSTCAALSVATDKVIAGGDDVWLRCAGDDFTLGGMIGPPSLIFGAIYA